ncbi:MAG: hypothetical protein ACOH1J_02660 [Microbacteriaceae bacterium]
MPQQVSVDLRAQAIYRRTEQILQWGNIAQSTRDHYKRRALSDIRLARALIVSADASDDDGHAELLMLDREADEVIHGTHRSG